MAANFIRELTKLREDRGDMKSQVRLLSTGVLIMAM